MADISDITSYLRIASSLAIYPSGTSQPSVAAMDVRVQEGWPNPDQLDLDLAGMTLIGVTNGIPVPRSNGKMANVSIFPLPGNNITPYQIQDQTYTIVPPINGLVVSVNGTVITITGTPTTGEYVTLVVDHKFVYSRSGVSAAAIIAALAADIVANYPGVSSTSSTLTIPFQFALVVRQGAVATLGKVIHRERQSIMISVWAPTHDTRTTLSKAIDVAIKSKTTITLPDTSQATVCYNRTNVNDDRQMSTIYRRDLIYDVEYATLQQFPGYVITTVNTSIANYNNSAVVPALT